MKVFLHQPLQARGEFLARLIYSYEDGFRLRMTLGQGLRLRLEANTRSEVKQRFEIKAEAEVKAKVIRN